MPVKAKVRSLERRKGEVVHSANSKNRRLRRREET